MPTAQEKFEQIERYLAGELPEAERNAFEAALQQDAALAEEVALQRALRQSLGNPRRRQLLDALSEVAEQPEQRQPLALSWVAGFRWAAAAAALLALAAVSTWWYQQQRPDAPPVAQHTTPPPPAAPNAGQTGVQAPTQTTPAPVTPAVSQEPAPDRLALADRAAFAANPALDPMAGTFVRGGDQGVSLAVPKNDAVFKQKNGRIQLALSGKSTDLTALELRIFNNREADFAAGKSLYRFELPVQDQAFSLNKSLQLAPGRYYAVWYAPGDEEPVGVLRFFVR